MENEEKEEPGKK